MPNAEAWEETRKKYDIPVTETYPSADARCAYFDGEGKTENFCLVTINHRADWDYEFTLALLVHEAVHCFQFLCMTIGEREPSIEFEAYTIQDISTFLFNAFKETRGGTEKEATD